MNTRSGAGAALLEVNNILKRIETVLLATCSLVLVLVIFIEVCFRYFFFISTAWAEELSRYLFIWLTFIGAAYAIDEGSHVEIDIFTQMLKKIKDDEKREKALNALTAVSMFSTCAFLIIFGQIFWGYMIKIWQTAQTSPTMGIPIGYVYLPVFVGTLVAIYHCLFRFLCCATKKIQTADKQGSESNTKE